MNAPEADSSESCQGPTKLTPGCRAEEASALLQNVQLIQLMLLASAQSSQV